MSVPKGLTIALTALSLLSSRGVVSADDKAEDEGRKEFEKVYRLEPGRDIKLVPLPRPKGTLAWMKKAAPHTVEQLDQVTALTFRWSDPDKLEQRAAHFGSADGWPLRSIPRYLEMGVHEFEIDGDRELLKTCIPGDWVYRDGISAEKKALALEGVLRKTLGPKVVVEFRLLERNVIVARGDYRYTPIGKRAEKRGGNHIEIYAREIVMAGGAGGGGGEFPEFLKWVADWIETPVVSEVTTPPEGNVSWSYNARNTGNAKEQQEDHDEALVLKHLHEQTNLTFTPEMRDVRVLVIEKAK